MYLIKLTIKYNTSSLTYLKCIHNTYIGLKFSSVQLLSHVWLFVTPKSLDCSKPGFPVHHQLLELAQTHVHRVGDAIQLSHPLLSPSPPAFNLSQHQCLFKWFSSLLQVAKVLELKLHYQSFQWIFRVDSLYNWHVWSPCTPRDSQESSPAPQFKSISWLLPILGEAWLGFLP